MNVRTEPINQAKEEAERLRIKTYGPLPINPFRQLRQENKLTISQVCAGAYVSKQAIIRLEQGTFDEPLPSVLEWFVRNYTLSELQLCDRYAEFQSKQRARHHHLFGPDLCVPNSAIHPLQYLRHRVHFSVTEVSKAMCVPQSALDRFEKKYRTYKSVPRTFNTALFGLGYTSKDINLFREQYEAFRESHLYKVKVS